MWGATCHQSFYKLWNFQFQSTLPVWGATREHVVCVLAFWISIHAPRVGSDICQSAPVADVRISIHAPRVGSDSIFLIGTDEERISIHAPRVGSDAGNFYHLFLPFFYFNPRSPCGERLQQPQTVTTHTYFNPRSPCGERLFLRSLLQSKGFISIHAPRVGSD